jgi:hypothetical protein
MVDMIKQAPASKRLIHLSPLNTCLRLWGLRVVFGNGKSFAPEYGVNLKQSRLFDSREVTTHRPTVDVEPNERGERQISAKDDRRHRDEIAAFVQLVDGDEVAFLSSSYRRWIDAALPGTDAEADLAHLRHRLDSKPTSWTGFGERKKSIAMNDHTPGAWRSAPHKARSARHAD